MNVFDNKKSVNYSLRKIVQSAEDNISVFGIIEETEQFVKAYATFNVDDKICLSGQLVKPKRGLKESSIIILKNNEDENIAAKFCDAGITVLLYDTFESSDRNTINNYPLYY
ncbi:hypothetical protein JGH11_08635 [Dysgonomonas sp. Marseille-P4677]|uniref:hypothetical protein n=1 Tax=Dysgonomonas sp. Marseille-P4677 TaxID=2364790 RepID=UPI0019142866|nr:hypothetical protein [Dysgonomonas sp. Marseille-P4677]MBK5720935.1 hypothetical protein [Dysgonomonas sp. Marseille-P4677]